MGETTNWIASQVASLVPNMFTTTVAAASSSGGSVQCFEFQECVNTRECPGDPSRVSGTFITECTDGFFTAVPECCPVVG